MCTFPHTLPGETIVVVGGGHYTKLAPRSCKKGFLRSYRITNNGTELEFLHMVPTLLSPAGTSEFDRRGRTGLTHASD